MSRVLVLYGTTHGHTARIAQSIGDTLRMMNVDVDVVDAAIAAARRPDQYDGVVIAASVHGGQYQRPVRDWVRANATRLRDRPSAFVSVCLAIVHPTSEATRTIDTVIDRFLAVTGWRPTTIKTVAGALPYTRYNWITRLIMKRIVRKAGGDTDTSRDYEYTDWADLRRFAEQFAAQVSAPKTVPPAGRVA